MQTLDHQRRRLELLELEWDATPLPAAPQVTGIMVDGQRPTPAEVAAVRAEVAKVPRAILTKWQREGGHLDVVVGRDAARHSRRFPDMTPCGAWHYHGHIVVAAIGRETRVLHEFGHFLDGAEVFSGSRAWRQIFEFERSWQGHCGFSEPFPDLYHTSAAAELFAQAFAMFFHSTYTRAQLTTDMQRFIAAQLTTCPR